MTTRREFLVYLAGIAASPALAQVERLERRGPPQRVIVIGAGLAGMCAAYELQSQGHTVSVLEAQRRPGGRVRTLREPFAPGLYVEAGAENIPGVHDLTQHYARTFGLKLVPNMVPGARSFYHVRGKRILPDDKAVWPFELTDEERQLGLSGLFRKYIDETAQQAMDSGFGKKPIPALNTWDPFTPGAWLRSRGASPGAAELLALGYGTEFGSAASFLLHRLNSMGSMTNYRIEGGNDRLPEEFSKRVEIRYGAPVAGVTQDDQSVKVTMGGAGGTETLTADRVVCAIPCPVIGKLFQEARLSNAKQKAIREQHYSRTVKVFLQTRTRFWLKERLNGYVTTDLPIERLTPDPGADPGARGALAAYPMAGYTSVLEKMSEAERVTATLGQAKQIFPELSKDFEGGVSHCWGLDPWQRGAFALHTPGQIGFIDTLAAAEGRIHFAGEHTSLWTGWMQGALESGRRVVREINAS
jgi:monoamine oxidase